MVENTGWKTKSIHEGKTIYVSSVYVENLGINCFHVFFTFHEVASSNTFVPPFLLRCLLRNGQEGGRGAINLSSTMRQYWSRLNWNKKMNLVVKQWTNIHKPFYDFLKNAAYFFSFKLIKFNKRKIAKIEIGCYVMNWREEPLTFPQECSNMCLALQMHKRSFQVPKNHNFAPKIFGIWLNGHCFFGTLPRCCFIIVIYPAYNNSP